MSDLNDLVNKWGLILGVGGLIAAMIFIIWDLAKKSNAGKFGTAILFLGLGVGILGFVLKLVIEWILESRL